MNLQREKNNEVPSLGTGLTGHEQACLMRLCFERYFSRYAAHI